MHFGRLTLIGVGIVLAVVLLGGSIFPTSMVSQKNTGFTLQTSNAIETLVSPKISTASVHDVMAKSTASISLPRITANFVLPFKQAFAITSTDLSVTSSEWTVLTAGSSPFGVAADSSGNVYFAESTGNIIGRLVPSTNVITEWTVPTARSSPCGVAADSSGNVYFAESTGNIIGRLVPSTNVITEWTVPTASSAPCGVAADSSGNVYFTEISGNNVGRLVPSTNVITEWTVPTASSSPRDVAADSSGNVYFGEL